MCLAIPGQVLEINKTDPGLSGRVSFGGAVRDINLSCVPEVKVGDYVVVHVGLALSIIDEDEAQKIFEHVAESEEILNQKAQSSSSSADGLG